MEDEPHGVHDFVYDPRNADVLISVNGELKHRDEATVSVFDSGYLLGDGVWEGLRVKNGGVAFLDEHLKRLYAGAKTIDMDIGLSKAELTQRLFDCLKAQDMRDGVHIRLMVTRGIKKTPYQGPRFTITKPTVVIIPEYKAPVPEVIEKGLSLFTVHVRRTGPAEQDQKLNSHSKLNCILACIQADKAGADEGLMLDADGFVATCNSTHFFIVRDGEVWTSPPDYCLGGITRGNIIRVCEEAGITVREKRFSLFDVYSADEAFVTGTFAGVTPVREVDGRTVEHVGGPMAQKITALYQSLVARSLTPIR
ncbi:aminotransferase class IV [Henriciella marina]|uniref:Probable branched-chain-amino-acid aminotransferase n=1 Tax=Henriciella marina TaxID=453851 RepID=A0ABT4LSK3_9PROT|nr:aminotransferase class IV [Henriciella marina]MCZ4297301.1 aminotransferase class IV [Henriciella marina]